MPALLPPARRRFAFWFSLPVGLLLSVQIAVGQPATAIAPVDSTPTARDIFNLRTAPWYVRTMPFAIYTGAGKTRDRIAQTIEVGKSFNVLDLGLAVGRSSLRPDTTLFLEGRVTMDVANYGIFASEMTIGAGKLFDTQGSLMLELSYTIFAQLGKRIGVGLTTGYYDFSNELYDASKTYYGIYFRYGIQRTDSGGLLGIGRIHSRPRGAPGAGSLRADAGLKRGALSGHSYGSGRL